MAGIAITGVGIPLAVPGAVAFGLTVWSVRASGFGGGKGSLLDALLLGLGVLALELRDALRARRRSGPSDRQTRVDEPFGDPSAGSPLARTTDSQ